MKPIVNRIRPTRVPLRWDRAGDMKIIGYYYPGQEIITTPKASYSEDFRPNLKDGKTMQKGNKMHARRLMAAYGTEDFIYRGE